MLGLACGEGLEERGREGTRFQWAGGVKILGFLEGASGVVDSERFWGVEEIDVVRETRLAGNLPARGIFCKSLRKTDQE